MATTIGEPNAIAISFFLAFIALAVAITIWAARRTRSTEHFYAAGRAVTAPQNGFALAGDFMSAAAFLARRPERGKPLTDGEIEAAMSGNLCRCGTYPRIRRAVRRAAELAGRKA